MEYPSDYSKMSRQATLELNLMKAVRALAAEGYVPSEIDEIVQDTMEENE